MGYKILGISARTQAAIGTEFLKPPFLRELAASTFSNSITSCELDSPSQCFRLPLFTLLLSDSILAISLS
jgi:hypothetical protein